MGAGVYTWSTGGGATHPLEEDMHIELHARHFELPERAREAILERAESLGDFGFEVHDANITVEASHGRFTAEMTV
jgi:ribosome-associated translation inhibitor RaiA